MTASVWVYCRELDGLLVEQCTVDTDTTTGQSVQAAIGNCRIIDRGSFLSAKVKLLTLICTAGLFYNARKAI